MRQVLINKNKKIKKLSDNQIVIMSSDDTITEVKSNGVTLARFPFKFEVISGGNVDIKFELPKDMAKKGVILLGAFYEQGEVEAIFTTVSSQKISLENDTPVLVGTLIETVKYRQVEVSQKTKLKIVGQEKVLPKESAKKKKKS